MLSDLVDLGPASMDMVINGSDESVDEENNSEEENRVPVTALNMMHDSDSETGGLVIETPSTPNPDSPGGSDLLSASVVDAMDESEAQFAGGKPPNQMSDEERKRRFVCNYCGKGFSLMNVLKVHERIHTGERPYVCNICNKAFNQSGSLNRHKQTHARRSLTNRYYTCRYCCKQFIHSSQLQAHEATHSSGDQQAPGIVNHRQQQQQDLKSAAAALNAAVTAATLTNYSCDLCPKRFVTEEELKGHKQEHFTMAQFALSAAGMLQGLFPDASQLLLPTPNVVKTSAAAVAANVLQYQNPLAMLTSNSLTVKQPLPDLIQQRLLRPHQQTQAPQADIFVSSSTSASTPLNKGHHNHILKPQCQQKHLATTATNSHVELQQQQQEQSRQKTPPPPASVQSSVQKRSSHGTTLYRCAMCAQKFNDATALHGHMRLHETNEGKKCIECGKQFTCASALKIHFRTHSGERPYTCSFCDKSFSQNGTLKRHHHTCKNARTWHNTSSGHDLFENDGCLDLTLRTQSVMELGMDEEDIAAEEEALDRELEEEELREAEEADAALEEAQVAALRSTNMTNIFSFSSPNISKAHIGMLLQSEDCVDGAYESNHFEPADAAKAINGDLILSEPLSSKLGSGNSCAPSGGKAISIDAICAALAEHRSHNPIQQQQQQQQPSNGLASNLSSSRAKSFMNDIEKRSVQQTSLTSLLDYLFLKGKLYRCEHCQIFFLDSAMYFLHRSQHASVGPDENPYTCSVCGFVAHEKYGFHSHFIENHGKKDNSSSTSGELEQHQQQRICMESYVSNSS